MTEKRRQFSPQFKTEAVHKVVGLDVHSPLSPGTWRSIRACSVTGSRRGARRILTPRPRRTLWRQHVWRRWSQESAGYGWKTSF